MKFPFLKQMIFNISFYVLSAFIYHDQGIALDVNKLTIPFSIKGACYMLRAMTKDDVSNIRDILAQTTPDTYPYKDLDVYTKNCKMCTGSQQSQEFAEGCLKSDSRCGLCQASAMEGNGGAYIFMISPEGDTNSVYGFIEVRSYYPVIDKICEYWYPILSFLKKTPLPTDIFNPNKVYVERLEDYDKVAEEFTLSSILCEELSDLMSIFEHFYSCNEFNYRLTATDLKNFLTYLVSHEDLSEDAQSISPITSSQDVQKHNEDILRLYGINQSDIQLLPQKVVDLYGLIMTHQEDLFGEIAWYMDKDCIGKGIGSAALRASIEHFIFQKTPVTVLMAKIADTNRPSCRGVCKLGFQNIDVSQYYREGKTIGHPSGGFLEKTSLFFLEKK